MSHEALYESSDILDDSPHPMAWSMSHRRLLDVLPRFYPTYGVCLRVRDREFGIIELLLLLATTSPTHVHK